MGLLGPIVRVLGIIMNSIRHKFTVSNTVAAQLIRHDLPWLAAIVPQQASKETLRSSTILFSLQIHINHLAILVNSSPQIVLLAIDLYKDLVGVKAIAITSVFSLQP